MPGIFLLKICVKRFSQKKFYFKFSKIFFRWIVFKNLCVLVHYVSEFLLFSFSKREHTIFLYIKLFYEKVSKILSCFVKIFLILFIRKLLNSRLGWLSVKIFSNFWKVDFCLYFYVGKFLVLSSNFNLKNFHFCNCFKKNLLKRKFLTPKVVTKFCSNRLRFTVLVMIKI